jgi:predicted nucleic acid-binding protein
MMKVVFDTNILIDYLVGVEAARRELALYTRPLISPITWIEVMVGAREAEEPQLRAFLDRFDQVPIDDRIAEITVAIRRTYRIRIPDAIIWASARSSNALLVTRNTRDFPAEAPDIRVPYAL